MRSLRLRKNQWVGRRFKDGQPGTETQGCQILEENTGVPPFLGLWIVKACKALQTLHFTDEETEAWTTQPQLISGRSGSERRLPSVLTAQHDRRHLSRWC